MKNRRRKLTGDGNSFWEKQSSQDTPSNQQQNPVRLLCSHNCRREGFTSRCQVSSTALQTSTRCVISAAASSGLIWQPRIAKSLNSEVKIFLSDVRFGIYFSSTDNFFVTVSHFQEKQDHYGCILDSDNNCVFSIDFFLELYLTTDATLDDILNCRQY